MEQVLGKCINCGGRDLRLKRAYVFQSDAFRKLYPDGGVYDCPSCGLIQANAQTIDNDGLTRYYQSAYRSEAGITSNESNAMKTHYAARGQALLAAVRAHLSRPPTRIFEVGAGYGYNLAAFGEAFPDAALLTDELDLELQGAMGTKGAQLEDGPYDIIIMSHVLEHFIDPKTMIARATSALAEDGVIVIEVPNDEDGISVITACDEPHIGFFGGETLAKLLNDTPGLDVQAQFTAGPNKAATMKRQKLKRYLSYISFVFPLVRRLRKGKSGVASQPDYITPTPGGLFLRAVAKVGSRA